MPHYPTPSEYQEAVQFPETAFADPELQAATPRENALGLPQPVTGAFAAVFPMEARTGVWAAKCFLTDVHDQPRRYRAIAKHLEKHELPCTVAFDYQPEGIRVGGRALPLLKMEWVEGTPLNRFVKNHLDAPKVLADLAERWAALLESLEDAGVAHGDLQHGNVFVVEADGALELKLVDYDTMFVPALSGRASPEVGHRNYQHPDRTEADFGSYLDRFAGLVVYAGLRACIRRPALWARYDTGENLLFRAADFYDPSASPLFAELEELEEEAVAALRTACYLEPEAAPPLHEVRAGTAALRQPLRRGAARRRRARHGARGAFAQWFLPAVVSVVVAAGLLLATGWWTTALVLLALGGIGAAWSSVYRYRQHPVVRRRRRLTQEARYFAEVIASLERQIAALEAQRRDVHQAVEKRRAERLRELQEKALYDKLKHHFIGEAEAVEGVSHKTVVRLKASGIRTAHEAAPERLKQVRQIGEKSKARVALWRAALVGRYEDTIPDALSPAEERRIERYVERRAEQLDAEMQRAREKKAVQQEERAQALARREEMPDLTFGRYLRYLLRLDTLPPLESAPPPKEQPEPTPQPAPAEDDRPWWTQTTSRP